MNQSFVLRSEAQNITLHTIIASDCESIRRWKNDNRFVFFFQEIITPQMQEEWFRKYRERVDDHMFIVYHGDNPIGCMGYRLIDGEADIYNVILGKPEFGGKGIMSQSLRIMCSYILSGSMQIIKLKVLKSNPALNWYLKNGFREISDQDHFCCLQLNIDGFKSCEIRKDLRETF
jgi:RimJ/RimL family protein N-acetyltransferase